MVECQKRCGPLELTNRGYFRVASGEWAAEYACPVCHERVDAPGETPSWTGITHPWPQDLLEVTDATKRGHAAVLVVGNDALKLAELFPIIERAVEDRKIGYLPVAVATTPTILHLYALPEDAWLAELAHSIVVRAGALVVAQHGIQIGNVLDATIRAVVRAARKEPLPCAIAGDADGADAWSSFCRPPSLVVEWRRDEVIRALDHLGGMISPVRRAKRWSPPD
jgi:hypothetical protein